MVTVALAGAPTPYAMFAVSVKITVSLASKIESSMGVIVTVAVVAPAAMTTLPLTVV